jgi:hypothetical protein
MELKNILPTTHTIYQAYACHGIRQLLIDCVYSTIDLARYRYKLIETFDQLTVLAKDKYHLSPNFTGINCLMIYTTNKDRFYSFIIDRKTLHHDKARLNIDAINIQPFEIGLHRDIYKGTVFDGVMHQNNGRSIYIITDVYTLCGEDLSSEQIKFKLLKVKTFLEENLTTDPVMNSVELMLNVLLELQDITDLINRKITCTIPTRGIAFYPSISGTRLIFNYTPSKPRLNIQRTSAPDSQQAFIACGAAIMLEKSACQVAAPIALPVPSVLFAPVTETQTPIVNEQTTVLPEHVRYISKTDDPVILVFELRRGELYDVYKLYLVKPHMINDRKVLKTERFGIACVPTIACSKMCREATALNGRALMRCQYDATREKWIPLTHETTQKCPDYVSTLESKMDIIMDD